MLNRRERRFADREAEKILARMKLHNKQILLTQPVHIEPMKVDDSILEEYKQYTDGMQLQKTTGDTEPSTNTGTNNT